MKNDVNVDLKKAQESINQDDPISKEAKDAIQTASLVINSVMSGRQLDVAFFKHLTHTKQQKIAFLKKVSKNIKKD